MTTQYRFIEPLDVLHLRGNHLFGGPGEHGAALVPPWPSTLAGAIRSAMLVHAGVDIPAFAAGAALPPGLAEVLGSVAFPGTFRLQECALARRVGEAVEVFRPLPADLWLDQTSAGLRVHRMMPQTLPPGMLTSAVTASLPVLRIAQRNKSPGTYWLNAHGWQAVLKGTTPDVAHLVAPENLYALETRLGIGLDEQTGGAADGLLYTSEVINLATDIGFAVATAGTDSWLPETALVRLGGDARGARLTASQDALAAEPDWAHIQATGRFRLITRSPGVFPGGWRLPGTDAAGAWTLSGVSAQLVAAAVPRHETVSGWDLVTRRPKTAQRAVPAGSVYWFMDLDGSVEALRKLAEAGLWPALLDSTQTARRAEGFNLVSVANY